MSNASELNVDSPESPPHALSSEAVVLALQADAVQGLSESEVLDRRREYGWNELESAPPVPRWRRFVAQFQSLVIGILIVAAIIAGALGELIDTLAILAIVVLNGVLGFFQEERAEQALAALQKLSSPMAKVLRGGKLQVLAARELVPGDRIELEAGDNVPADSRLISSFGLRVQEAALTGESVPTDKDADAILDSQAPLGDRTNMLFLGTVVTAGKASAIVTAIGMQTQLGQIAGLLQTGEREPTPLQRRLSELGRTLVYICLGIVLVIFILQMLRGGEWLEVLLMAVSLAVAAVPEGLPAVVTVTLALGLQRMAKRNALVRKLPSVETLGTVTVICSDKTGTLTRNEMTVREIWSLGGVWSVTGSGYLPQGQFLHGEHGSLGAVANLDPQSDLIAALKIGAYCNNARVTPHSDQPGQWQLVGDPTEGALVVAAMKAGIDPTESRGKLLFEFPFDSDRKMMSVILRDESGIVRLLTKGAPEMVTGHCSSVWSNGTLRPITAEDRQQIDAANNRLATRALRVLALAQREIGSGESMPTREESLAFVGLIGMMDPPREEVKDAVRRCHEAGIRPVMITGDHPDTAKAIADELHIADKNSRVMTGQQVDAHQDEEFASSVEQVAVFARVTAEHKLRVVRALQARGDVVAMTGDGVNDAPAIKAADIGIVMGITGTDVTKEAADMVLTDDNFTSIVNAVEEGRGIFDNIQKFLHFLLSSNASEVLFMFAAAVLGWPAPLIPIQLLWINLVTDSFPALALALEPPERDIMQRQPRPSREPVITWTRGRQILTHGSLIALATMAGFWLTYRGDESSLAVARTVAFSVLTFCQIFYSLGCRSQRFTMPHLGLLSNPYIFGAMALSSLLQLSILTLTFVQPIFGVVPLPTSSWILVMVLSLIPVTIVEVSKLIHAAWRTNRYDNHSRHDAVL